MEKAEEGREGGDDALVDPDDKVELVADAHVGAAAALAAAAAARAAARADGRKVEEELALPRLALEEAEVVRVEVGDDAALALLHRLAEAGCDAVSRGWGVAKGRVARETPLLAPARRGASAGRRRSG